MGKRGRGCKLRGGDLEDLIVGTCLLFWVYSQKFSNIYGYFGLFLWFRRN
jgi:hypothetical protein